MDTSERGVHKHKELKKMGTEIHLKKRGFILASILAIAMVSAIYYLYSQTEFFLPETEVEILGSNYSHDGTFVDVFYILKNTGKSGYVILLCKLTIEIYEETTLLDTDYREQQLTVFIGHNETTTVYFHFTNVRDEQILPLPKFKWTIEIDYPTEPIIPKEVEVYYGGASTSPEFFKIWFRLVNHGISRNITLHLNLTHYEGIVYDEFNQPRESFWYYTANKTIYMETGEEKWEYFFFKAYLVNDWNYTVWVTYP